MVTVLSLVLFAFWAVAMPTSTHWIGLIPIVALHWVSAFCQIAESNAVWDQKYSGVREYIS